MKNKEIRHELLNQSLKGLMAGMGHGSGATRSGHLVTLSAPVQVGEGLLCTQLIHELVDRPNGCYVVVASKVVSISESRLVRVPRDPLPPRRSPRALFEILKRYGEEQGQSVSMRDAIGADLISDDGNELTFALLPINPNRSAYNFAQELGKEMSAFCDVIITDTSAGWLKGKALIGVPTYVATPIGITAGCDIYYAQRLAALAEIMRNEVPLSPFVVVQPPTVRSLTRGGIGEMHYDGFVDFNKEGNYLE